MEKKIVILFEVHPIATYAQRYDYQTLVDRGYKIDICDMSGIVSKYHDIGENVISECEEIAYYKFEDKLSFRKYIENIDQEVFIWVTFQLTSEYLWIFNVISKKHYGFICNLDYVFPRCELRKKERSYWTDLSWHRIANSILYRMPRKYIPIKKADAVITYGVGDVERKLRNVLYDSNTVIELTNTIDYNECARLIGAEDTITELPEEFIVFIDEYMPYHPDGLKLGQIIDAKKYYTEVESFLHRISDEMGLPVVVAAHPKADYSVHKECYKGMRIIQFKTAELIKKSKMVITHASIAISMIMISRKPFLLISTDEVEAVIYPDGLSRDQAKDLRCELINISENFSRERIKKYIDEAFKLGTDYYDWQISKYRLPIGHSNSELSLGQIMIKAMERK